MIVDSHCHAWARWPYDPAAPDSPQRGSIEALRYEMRTHAIDRAIVIAANLRSDDPRADNPDNNAYVAAAVRADPERLVLFADVDSFWSREHHRPGAVDRLTSIVDEFDPAGIVHYATGDDDGWLCSTEGLAFFERIAELGLVASLHLPPEWHESLAELAARVPRLPILLHHLGLVPSGGRADSQQSKRLLDLAAVPNVYLKVSGFHYLTDRSWGYPFTETDPFLREAAHAFGPERLVWGSDTPVAKKHVSLRQTIEIVHERLGFLNDREIAMVMGGTIQGILDAQERKGR